MKKIAILLISLGLLVSCAHKHSCACGNDQSACTGCKQTDGSKTDSCACDKK